MLKPIVSALGENIVCNDSRLWPKSAFGGTAMSTLTKTMGAATVGGLVVYCLDPDTGRRRRALVKDRAVNFVKEADRAIGKASRDLSNRARGTVAEARSLLPFRDVSDEVLVEQVPARIGRVISYPHFVELSARDAAITLSGAVLERGLGDHVYTGSSLPHVLSVRNEPTGYARPPDIPGVRHGAARRRPAPPGC